MFEEHALATATFPYERCNLIFVNHEIRLVENGIFVKPFGNVSEFYQGRFHSASHEKGRNNVVGDEDQDT